MFPNGNQLIEYQITYLFLESNSVNKLLNTYDVGNSLYSILHRKLHNIRYEELQDAYIISITNTYLIMSFKAKTKDLKMLYSFVCDVKSDITCLVEGKLFKKQHYVEKNRLTATTYQDINYSNDINDDYYDADDPYGLGELDL